MTAHAGPADIVNTLGNPSTQGDILSAGVHRGQAFRTGTNSARLTSVSASLFNVAGAGVVGVRVHSDNGGQPGTVVAPLP